MLMGQTQKILPENIYNADETGYWTEREENNRHS